MSLDATMEHSPGIGAGQLFVTLHIYAVAGLIRQCAYRGPHCLASGTLHDDTGQTLMHTCISSIGVQVMHPG